MSWLHAARARARLLVARRAAESRMGEEISFHVEMETARLVREQGLPSEEARRQALVTFGGVERHKEALRDGRGLSWLGGFSLDLRLGVRMLIKYPGLAVVGVLGMAVAVALGAVAFSIIYQLLDPRLPLDEGDRVVAIDSFDPTTPDRAGNRTHLHDLAVWREALTAVADLGAYRTADRNLITTDGQAGAVRVAEMTASGFRIARVPPLLGRWLLDADEAKGAPPVVVIGHDLWERRFARDSAIIGRTLRLGSMQHAIVGVMPAGFGFPINNRVWTPLRLDPVDFERGEAPIIEVFGRLAPGATLEDAQAQLIAIGRRLALEHPETHATVRTYVSPYAVFFGDPEMAWVLHLAQVLLTMLLALIGTNVAVLVYARTASRAGEIAVRTALGASRRRIVAQLFAEALVLSSAAAVVGLVFARIALAQLGALVERAGGEQIPFWVTLGITPGVVLYVAGLTILAAAIIGIVPALGATRQRVHAGLQHLGMGSSGMRLGGTWTALIVAQVAIAVAVLPVAFEVINVLAHEQMAEPAFATEGMLTTSLRLDREGFGTDDFAAYDARDFRATFAQRQEELVRRLESEPAVANVVLMDGLPSSDGSMRIAIDGATALSGTAADSSPVVPRTGIALVEPDYFDLFDIPLLAGRTFERGDVSTSARVAIVSRSFAQRFGGSGNPLGLRVRRVVGSDTSAAQQREPWYEIVGVVADVPQAFGDGRVRMYQPLLPGGTHPVRLVVELRGSDPASFASRLREIALELDPMLRLDELQTVDAAMNDDLPLIRLGFAAVFGLTLSILLLSAAGIYALMSFTVARRRREIGIRSALGARPHLLIGSVLAKAIRQIALGIGVGAVLAGFLIPLLGQDDYPVLRLVLVAVFMSIVGLAAAAGPARRALRIQPTEALKAS